MRLATTIVFLALAAALIGGCGGSGESSTSTTGPHVGNRMPHMGNSASMSQMRAAWTASPACRHPHRASRWACSVGPYRCQAVVTGRGWSVDCAMPGRSIPFTVPPRK